MARIIDIAIFIGAVLLASPIICVRLIIALPFELSRVIKNPEAK